MDFLFYMTKYYTTAYCLYLHMQLSQNQISLFFFLFKHIYPSIYTHIYILTHMSQ